MVVPRLRTIYTLTAPTNTVEGVDVDLFSAYDLLIMDSNSTFYGISLALYAMGNNSVTSEGITGNAIVCSFIFYDESGNPITGLADFHLGGDGTIWVMTSSGKVMRFRLSDLEMLEVYTDNYILNTSGSLGIVASSTLLVSSGLKVFSYSFGTGEFIDDESVVDAGNTLVFGGYNSIPDVMDGSFIWDFGTSFKIEIPGGATDGPSGISTSEWFSKGSNLNLVEVDFDDETPAGDYTLFGSSIINTWSFSPLGIKRFNFTGGSAPIVDMLERSDLDNADQSFV